MKNRIYIFSDSIIRKKDNTFLQETVCSEDEELREECNDETFLEREDIPLTGEKRYLPIESIDSIFSFGGVRFNSRFLYFLTRNEIPLHIFSYNGEYSGSFMPMGGSTAGTVMVKQSLLYADTNKRLAAAKEFIKGAAHNSIMNLQYHRNRGRAVHEELDCVRELSGQIDDALSIQELMGIEGIIKKEYYSAWKNIFGWETGFVKRVKRPPDNLINALISYGNAVVYSVCLNEIFRTRIYPEIGFLHQPGNGKYSLSYDIAEIFKPLITDRVIFKVINKGIITERDVYYKNGGCYLRKSGKKAFIVELENKLTTTLFVRENEINMSYRRLIREECYKLLQLIENGVEYESYRSKW